VGKRFFSSPPWALPIEDYEESGFFKSMGQITDTGCLPSAAVKSWDISIFLGTVCYGQRQKKDAG